MTLCWGSLQTCFAPYKAVCLQYRSIRAPTGGHALYIRSYHGDGLCTPLGRCRRQRSHCTKDSKRCIRYNAYRLLRQLLRAEAHRSIMSTAVLEGGYVREDIRLGNEALTRQDLDTARQYFQQVLVSDDATVMQKRIAANRLREIDERQQPPAEPRPRSPAKPRARRKSSDAKQQAEAPAHRFVRPPDKPVVVINRH